jgi:hypothetical protein
MNTCPLTPHSDDLRGRVPDQNPRLSQGRLFSSNAPMAAKWIDTGNQITAPTFCRKKPVGSLSAVVLHHHTSQAPFYLCCRTSAHSRVDSNALHAGFPKSRYSYTKTPLRVTIYLVVPRKLSAAQSRKFRGVLSGFSRLALPLASIPTTSSVSSLEPSWSHFAQLLSASI